MTDAVDHPALAELLLAVADDKLFLGHRNSDWTGLAPILEEDIAFSSIAQDEIGHASALYDFVAAMTGGTADSLAYGRNEAEYRNATIVEMPDEFDWATAVARQFFCDHFDALRLERLSGSANANLAALARRLAAEEAVHVRHVDEWIRCLGRGTDESRQRLQAALDGLAPHAVMLAEPVDGEDALVAAGLYPALPGDRDMFDQWGAGLRAVADEAGLTLELPRPDPATRGGRRGAHSPHLATMLDEMCEVYRLEPDAAW